MRIGFCADYARISGADMDWARENAFFGLELMGWDYDGILNALESVKRTMDDHGLEIVNAGIWGNQLDPSVREASQRRQAALIDKASKLGIKKIATFAGRDNTVNLDANLRLFGEFWAPLAKRAQDNGVQICLENCPMFDPNGLRSSNMATSPVVWERMFNEVDSPALGLEFDPSHLYWLQIDYLAAARKFGSRIGLVHAKDTEILGDKLGEAGILGTGWWRYRLPGMGSVDWKAFVGVLREVGYSGDLSIEHEDPLYHGDKVREGLVLGRKHLEKVLAE